LKPHNHANAIVLCCTANWLPYAAATLLSCVQHGADKAADLHVAVIGATAADHEKFADFITSHGFPANVIDATLPQALAGFPALRFSPAALLRLKLDEILPTRYARVLYLDCDILADGQVADIFAADLKGKALGAVEDYQSLPGPLAFFSSHTKNIGLGKNAPYFNSGVLLFDWPKVREKAHLRHCVERIASAMRKGKGLNLPDQDVLNLEFAGDWQRLDLRFNLMAFFVDYFPAAPVFRHFSNRQKPWGDLWQPGFARAREFYRSAFAQSPWPEYVPGRYKRPSFEGTGGIVLRKLDPISGRRYRKHLERP
jgi:lipopolysaccharide biosynthesis glycosyltransferase